MRSSLHGLRETTVDDLSIRDEAPLRHVPLYRDLKEILRRAGYAFRVLPKGARRWDRALFLNLTFWGMAGGDVLDGPSVAADVIGHAAWHHLASRALAGAAGAAPSIEALCLGEAIASAFDVYLVGRLLQRAPRSVFLRTQVPAMAEAARAAGCSKRAFQALLTGMSDDPARSFGDLRSLLFDVTLALTGATGPSDALGVLVAFERHRFAPLLHHYEVSNWVLFAKAYAKKGRASDARTRALDRTLKASGMPLAWLAANWVAPALARVSLTCL